MMNVFSEASFVLYVRYLRFYIYKITQHE
jgi:hypothetical protein